MPAAKKTQNITNRLLEPMNTKKPRPLLRTKPGKIGTGKLDKNAVVRHESHLEVPGNEEQSKSATKWWEDK